jgi:GGDEF domain-containing protein/ParB-like chromosome segregation protein Spo0J
VPNPRFQLSSSATTDPYARYGGKVAASGNAGSTNEHGSFTSIPAGVTPEQEARQLPLPKEQPQGSKTSDVVRVGPQTAAEQGKARFEEARAQAQAAKMEPQPQPAQPTNNLMEQSRARFEAARNKATASQNGDIFPNDKAMEDWLNNQYERSPRIQRIKDLVKERIEQGDLPSGIRPSADELARMNSQIHNMIADANGQGIDTPAQLDRIDQWIRQTNKPPKPFQPGQPLKTRPAPTQQALPQDVPAGRTEQRTNLDYRAQVDAMSPADQAKAIFFSEKTGLPNYRAFQQSAKLLGDTHPLVGYADVDDFKSANTALGKVAVDTKILPMIGDLFKEAAQDEPGVHVFHRSGDEFLFRADDPAAVTRVVNRVNEQLQGAKFTAQREDGSIVEHTGTGLSHGTGATEDAAELAAEDSKQQRKLQGLRTGARDTATAPVQTADTQPEIFQGSRQGSEAAEGNASQRSNLLVRPAASLKPGDSSLVPTSDLKADPSRFQYKGGTNEEGVTNALKDQNKYDANKGGVLLTWKDPANGQTYVVNGHHRFELAQRAGEPNVLVRAIDAADAEEAKVIGAETNISEGHGSIVDAARYFKAARISTPQDAMNRNLPMGQAKVKDGLAMARLDNSILDSVESGRIPEGRAVAIGSVTDNPAQQDAVLQAIAKAEKRSGRDLNNGEVESIARQVKASSSHMEQGQDLFGMFNREQSLYGEQAAIDDYVLKQLSGDKRTFGAVSSSKRAEALGTVEGQKINATENQRISEQAAQAAEIYKKLVNSPGALNDIRTNAAKGLAGRMNNPNAVKAQAYSRIRQELMKHIGGESSQAAGTQP